ncbi:phosphotransferase [Bacillus sp. JJ1533]|uniref:phosphotransferase enzyme family protein n=1 Tax=Bacillus sp. JJ1533 TaxID=3122959 RepID=UPI00300018E4
MSQSASDPLQNSLNKFSNIANLAVNEYPFLTDSTSKLLNYSENATYLVTNKSNGEKYVLRVGRPGYHSKTEVQSELDWLTSIDQDSSINVSIPIAGGNREYVQEVVYQGETYYCTLFSFLEGTAPDEENEDKLIKEFESLGEVTAQLHEHSIRNRKKLAHITRLTWDYDSILGPSPKWGRWEDGLGITPERKELFQKVSEKIKKRLEAYGKDPERYGLIHSDLRLANLLVEKGKIKVIDFDDCGFGWYLYDFATSLSFIEHKPYVPALIDAWITGYRKVRQLTMEDVNEIPTFIMMRRLQLIAWVGSRDNETTRELGSNFSVETDEIAKTYLLYTKI